jgi:hypothetical protein
MLPEAQLGPAEKLLDLLLNSSAHLWHHRPGFEISGVWHAKRGAKPELVRMGTAVAPGLFVPAAASLYSRLLQLYETNVELAARFASYALTQTDWRDLKVACAALMLVQQRSGQPVHDDDGSVAFYDDDYRRVGEAMILHYAKKSTRMLAPKAVLRVAELLEAPEIAALNRLAGFADPASQRAPLGRWKRAATKWLAFREKNEPLLQGLVAAGYKETIKKIARKAGYKPESERFFAILGWKQKQAEGGHRSLGLDGLVLEKRDRFDGLTEAEICESIESQRLKYKDVMGRLPADVGLTPAIMVALLPSLSDRDLRIITPTLEDLGLMAEPTIRARWEKAIQSATDQRSLSVAKNVKNTELKAKLEEAADNAVQAAVKEATQEQDIRIMFLIDKSGSMSGAIEQSVEALTQILAGFPEEKLHIATFDTMGTVLRPKATSRAGVQHMLSGIKAEGGTIHGAALHAFYRSGVRIPFGARLIVICVGDEAGENGAALAGNFKHYGYDVAAMALLVNVAHTRGNTVRTCAEALQVPCSEIRIDQFDDPYQVPRVLKALLDAPRSASKQQFGLVERVMSTPLLEPPQL